MRQVGIMLHPTRPEAIDVATDFVRGVSANQITCRALADQFDRLEELRSRVPEIELFELASAELSQLELIVVFGGDGTILRAAEYAVPAGVPLLGVNLGHVGFLAELESYDVPTLVTDVANQDYFVEERLTLVTQVIGESGEVIWESLAINEVTLEKTAREKMLDILVEIDKLPVSRWSCDGMIVATPTGSTAYAFSLGGPVIWPDVQAFQVVPMAAHALFARPLVLDPGSKVDLTFQQREGSDSAVIWCDGRRSVEVGAASRVHVERGEQPMRVARLQEQPFTSRLVKKFDLNIEGFRRNGAN